MNEIYFEKMEAYLNDEMNIEDRKRFELDIASNHELASTFNIYKLLAMEGPGLEKNKTDEIALRNSLKDLNKKYFSTNTGSATPIVAMNRNRIFKIIASVAACFIMVISSYFLFFQSNTDAHQLAVDYTNNKLTHIAVSMGTSTDSMQLAIDAYNKNDYNKSLKIFNNLYQTNTSNNDALKYAGFVYLVRGEFENALKYFDLLSQKQLANNPGMFLKAVTLLKRNKDGDKENSKALLQQVVKEKAEGDEEAQEWLKKF